MPIMETFRFCPTDKANLKPMLKAEILLWILNRTPEWRIKKRRAIIKKLLDVKEPIYEVVSPFHCQYGKNIHVGKNFFSNYNVIIMDHADVFIGDDVFIAPNVLIAKAKRGQSICCIIDLLQKLLICNMPAEETYCTYILVPRCMFTEIRICCLIWNIK